MSNRDTSDKRHSEDQADQPNPEKSRSSPASPTMPTTVLATPPLHAAMPFLPAASAMPFAPAGPVMPIPIDMRSEPSDDFSIDPDSLSQKRFSSPPVPVSVALDPSRIPTTVEGKDSEINRLRMTVDLLKIELDRVRAQTDAYKAYRDAMMQRESELGAELKERKRKVRQFIEHKPRTTTSHRKRRKGPVGERSGLEGNQEGGRGR